MAKESVVIENESGVASSGEADEILRYSDAMRITLGTMWIVGCIVGGLVSILIPVVHFVAPWALPWLGVVMGRRALRCRAEVFDVTGACPSCGEPLKLHGGSVDEPSWQACLKCKARLKIRPAQG